MQVQANTEENEDEGLTSERAAELLRLSLPLMSRHGVPATPANYAVWYGYVNGDNPDLSEEIDRLIEKGEPFTAARNAELYRRHVAERDICSVEEVRAQLNLLLNEVGAALGRAGSDARDFEGTLGGIASEVSAKDGLRDIRRLLETLVSETRSMQTAAGSMHAHFESKSREIEELRDQLQRERQRAITDPLTGLHNRLALFERLQSAVADMTNDVPPAVIMLDIDHFKAINDRHGHLIGDRVIRFVAQTLLSNIKGRDTAARYGGEEFTVLLPGTPLAGAEAVAESIRRVIAAAKLVRADNKEPLGKITLSAGVAVYRPGEDISEVIGRADKALYRAKREGRNRVCVA